ncbi:unnamed protein product [Blepharisma stoltei]|uniref:Phosphoribosyltransferase domain-containing protein n=1 Tax=Blepharisma stoltei TaxID=1481888 RepID=A0AAU9INH4_9CILI|nr:unnamed protein product [Blepharisma stoltei]
MEKGPWIFVEDDGYVSPSLYSVPSHYSPYIGGIFVPRGMIQDRIKKIAEDVINYFQDHPITILVVLRGAFRYAKDLIEAIDAMPNPNFRHYNLEFIRARSYVNNVQQDVLVEGLDQLDLTGKHVLIVEDLVDRGKTLSRVAEIVREKNPADLKISVLAYKRNPINQWVVPDFIGFSLPNDWIIGYHIDYNNHFRDLPHICKLNEAGIEKFRV